MSSAIETRSLRKVFPPPSARRRGGPTVQGLPGMVLPPGGTASPGAVGPDGIVAIDSLDLAVGDGEFFGLLGIDDPVRVLRRGKRC